MRNIIDVFCFRIRRYNFTIRGELPVIDIPGIEKILSIALQRGGDFADVFIERKQGTGVTYEADRVEKIHSGMDSGAGVRVVFQGRTSYAYTNDVTFESLSKIAHTVSKAVETVNDVSVE